MHNENTSLNSSLKTGPEESASLTPVKSTERIGVIDVVRGFALIGIFLMNIEFFNRSISDIGQGMPAGLTGWDWLASYVVAYFVAGKFWTIFSLLFGMGFAIMLTRSEHKGHNFLNLYTRRILALAAFGLLHHILIWPGDILMSYAIGAAGMLLILFAPALSFFILIGMSIAPLVLFKLDVFGALIFAIVNCGVMAFYIRSEKKWRCFSRDLPVFPALFFALALILFVAGGLGFLLPKMAMTKPLVFAALFVAVLASVMLRFHEPKEKRPLRAAVAVYVLLFSAMTLGTYADYQSLKKLETPTTTQVTPAAVASATIPAVAKATESASAASTNQAEAGALKRMSERKKAQEKHEKEKSEELRILTTGTYVEAVQMRAHHFAGHFSNELGMSILIISMFLIGFWFVRSGIMEHHAEHLGLFKKLAFIGIPVGWTLSIVSSQIATAPAADNAASLYETAMGLLYLGNLPTCLGYVSLVILMCHSAGVLGKIKLLAPYGRMALTNYLSQSVICSLVFYHYGLGMFGMPRAQQVGFVFAVVAVQVAFSHWWLSKFLYGPMEWLWRAITYWHIPAFKVVDVKA